MAAYIALETSKHPDLVKLTGGYTRRDLDTPLHEWVNAQGKDGKLRFVFEVALEMTDSAKFIKRL